MRRLFAWYRSRRGRALAALVCIGLMLVAVNILADRFLPQRLDLTAERLYTLSPGTRRTLARIDEPIILRLYYSTGLGEALPSYAVYEQRVRELLAQYVAAAHGKLILEVYRPLPFSDAEDRAVAFGLQGVPLNTEGEQVYFGLAGTNSTDDTQVIPFFAPQRERLLEYDLTRLVHALAVPKRTVVGLISSLPLDGDPTGALEGGPGRPSALLQQLRQLDDVVTLPLALDAIPAGTDVLMLVQPQKLPEQTLFAIDQFVLGGGAAIVFVDPYAELAARGSPPGKSNGSDLDPLFKAWGLKLLANTVAADRSEARRVVVPASGGGAAIDYVAWLSLHDGALNRGDLITAGLHHVTMASAGIIERLPGATTRLEPLITTSRDAMKLPVEKIAGLPDVAGLLTNFKSEHTRYILAARVTGPATTAFPDGPPYPRPHPKARPLEGEVESGPDPATEGRAGHSPAETHGASAAAEKFRRRSVRPIDVVAVADTDLLDDRLWAQTRDFFGRRIVVPTADNGDFVANAVEVLAGGDSLVGLRSRGSAARPFEVVERIQRAADARYAAEQRRLEDGLKATEARLRALTAGEAADAEGASAAASPEQAKAVAQFRADMLATRRELRGVQAALRQDIAFLKALLEFCDIALVPLLVALTAIVLAAQRRRRRRRAAV